MSDQEDLMRASDCPSGHRREGAGDWMRGNLTTRGYCLSDVEHRELWLAVRFATGLCLALVVAALAPRSASMVLALVPVGALAGFTARHPFDHVWNHAVRHVLGGPPLPPNPARRRHAFKLATAWLAGVGVLLAAGATTASLVLGGLLVGACATTTAANLCLPSETLALWTRITTREKVVTR